MSCFGLQLFWTLVVLDFNSGTNILVCVYRLNTALKLTDKNVYATITG